MLNEDHTMQKNDSPEAGTAASEETAALRPTYAPAAMAMGIMMLLWGILTNWIMSAAGAALMAWALWTWIEEIHEA